MQAQQRETPEPAASFPQHDGRAQEDLIERVKALALHAPHANGDAAPSAGLAALAAGAPLNSLRGKCQNEASVLVHATQLLYPLFQWPPPDSRRWPLARPPPHP